MHAFVLMAAVTLAQAESPANPSPEDLAVKVKTLVKQLDSVQQARRDAAEKELIELGLPALEHLPALGPSTPAEVKTRIARIRQTMADQLIAATTRPTLVTLEGELRFSEALAAIEKQSGNRFEDYREKFNQLKLDPPIKLALKKVSFWEALDTVLDEGEMTIYNYDEEADALAYVSRGEAAPRKERCSYGGPFRFDPVRVEASRDLRNPAAAALRVAVAIAWEPRVRPIVLHQPLAEVKAVDDQGREVAVSGETEDVEVPVEFNNAGVELDIPLQLPDRSAKQIKSLKGRISATIPGRMEAFEFAAIDKTKDEEQERGGVTVTLEFARKNVEIYDVQLRVRFDKAANALESHRGWIYNNPAYLLDAKGNRIENAGLEATLIQANEVGLSYKFDLDKTPLSQCRFVYKTPAAIFKIPVPFELRNIDLP